MAHMSFSPLKSSRFSSIVCFPLLGCGVRMLADKERIYVFPEPFLCTGIRYELHPTTSVRSFLLRARFWHKTTILRPQEMDI
jgi:hypothetical protein